MNQNQNSQTTSDEFQKKFREIKAIEIPVLYRTVKLKYKSCCGCGCSYVTIYRKVPADSLLKDGDRVASMIKGDKWNP